MAPSMISLLPPKDRSANARSVAARPGMRNTRSGPEDVRNFGTRRAAMPMPSAFNPSHATVGRVGTLAQRRDDPGLRAHAWGEPTPAAHRRELLGLDGGRRVQ